MSNFVGWACKSFWYLEPWYIHDKIWGYPAKRALFAMRQHGPFWQDTIDMCLSNNTLDNTAWGNALLPENTKTLPQTVLMYSKLDTEE